MVEFYAFVDQSKTESESVSQFVELFSRFETLSPAEQETHVCEH